MTTVADGLPGPAPHRPNDLCFAPDGRLLVTDSADWEAMADAGPGRLLAIGADGAVEVLLELPGMPNGLAFAPDGATLYLAQTMTRKILALAVRGDGSLGEPTTCPQFDPAVRLAAGPLMNLGDVTSQTVPKMSLLSPPARGGAVSTRTLIPHRVHEAIGVLGAVSVATACLVPGSVASEVADLPEGADAVDVVVEHPSGFFTVSLDVDRSGPLPEVRRAALLRTARLLMRGHAMVPTSVWEGA